MDTKPSLDAYQESIGEMQRLIAHARAVRERVFVFAEFLNGPMCEVGGEPAEPARGGFLGLIEGSCAALRREMIEIDRALTHAQRNSGPTEALTHERYAPGGLGAYSRASTERGF